MKRGKGLRAKKPMQRSGPMKRTGYTMPRSAIRRTKSVEEQLASAAWKCQPHEVCSACGKPGTRDNPLEAHHVVSKHKLEQWCDTVVARGQLRGLELHVLRARVLWDTRNRMPLHATRHHRHTRGTDPLPQRVLTAAHRAFAAEYGYTWYLDKRYRDEGTA
jgi:hypothetical protein